MSLNRTILRLFWRDEAGAVTTDWVVLAAAVIGLGVAALSMVSTGSLDLASDISDRLSQTEVGVGTTTSDDGTAATAAQPTQDP